MENSPMVSLVRAASYDAGDLSAAFEELLRPLGGMEAFVRPGDRVVLKPNLLVARYADNQTTTHPEIVRWTAKRVLDAGGRPVIGDSPAFGSARGVAAACGIAAVARELGVPVVEFHGVRVTSPPGVRGPLRLAREVLEADLLINLPKVKSHGQMMLSLAVKNLYGCLPGKLKAWWHLELGADAGRFSDLIVETARLSNSGLTIADGVIAHQGKGPVDGEPRFLGLLGASASPYALDLAMADILGIGPEDSPVLKASQRAGLCPADLDALTFPNLHPEELRVDDWKRPPVMSPVNFRLPRVIRSVIRHFYQKLVVERFRDAGV